MSTQRSSSSRPGGRSSRIAVGRLWWIALVAIVAASAVALLAREVATGPLRQPADFLPFGTLAVVGSVVVGVIGATLVFALVGRLSTDPIRTFVGVSVVALLLSLVPNVLLALADPASPPIPGGGPATATTLGVMHLTTAAIVVGLLTRLGVREDGNHR